MLRGSFDFDGVLLVVDGISEWGLVLVFTSVTSHWGFIFVYRRKLQNLELILDNWLLNRNQMESFMLMGKKWNFIVK